MPPSGPSYLPAPRTESRCDPISKVGASAGPMRPRRLPMLSRPTPTPPACIQPPTRSGARRMAPAANGRVRRSGSSLHAASASHRAITVSASVNSARSFGESDLLRAFPEDLPAELAQVLDSFVDRGEVVARQLPHLAGEQGRAVREEDLGLADAAGVEQQVPRRGMAGVVLVAEVEVERAERDPRRLAAPAGLDQLGAQRQHRLEGRACLRPGVALHPGEEADTRGGYLARTIERMAPP